MHTYFNAGDEEPYYEIGKEEQAHAELQRHKNMAGARKPRRPRADLRAAFSRCTERAICRGGACTHQIVARDCRPHADATLTAYLTPLVSVFGGTAGAGGWGAGRTQASVTALRMASPR